jgi:hypothetical protein
VAKRNTLLKVKRLAQTQSKSLILRFTPQEQEIRLGWEAYQIALNPVVVELMV